jgi:hypothetical protein
MTTMWPKLRIPAFIASHLFAVYAVLFLIAQPGGKLFATLHPIEAREAAQRNEILRAGRRAYASRLREDAMQRRAIGDFDNAYARLLDAANWDPEGDQTPSVQELRRELEVKMAGEKYGLSLLARVETELKARSSAPPSAPEPGGL